MTGFRSLTCPLCNGVGFPYRKCSGNPNDSEKFDPCPDCPIDWNKVERQ